MWGAAYQIGKGATGGQRRLMGSAENGVAEIDGDAARARRNRQAERRLAPISKHAAQEGRRPGCCRKRVNRHRGDQVIGGVSLDDHAGYNAGFPVAQEFYAANWARVPATEMLATLTARFHDFGSNAQSMALKQMMLMARQQATVMSFADVFLMLTVLFVALAALGIVMKRPAAVAADGGGH